MPRDARGGGQPALAAGSTRQVPPPRAALSLRGQRSELGGLCRLQASGSQRLSLKTESSGTPSREPRAGGHVLGLFCPQECEAHGSQSPHRALGGGFRTPRARSGLAAAPALGAGPETSLCGTGPGQTQQSPRETLCPDKGPGTPQPTHLRLSSLQNGIASFARPVRTAWRSPAWGPAERRQPAWGWGQGGLAAGELRALGPFHQAESRMF